jgi:hypothetical protein
MVKNVFRRFVRRRFLPSAFFYFDVLSVNHSSYSTSPLPQNYIPFQPFLLFPSFDSSSAKLRASLKVTKSYYFCPLLHLNVIYYFYVAVYIPTLRICFVIIFPVSLYHVPSSIDVIKYVQYCKMF